MKRLTDQQQKYAEGRMAGLRVRDAAIFAGCPEKTASQAGSRLERHPLVQAKLVRLKQIEAEQNPEGGCDAVPKDAFLSNVVDSLDFMRQAMKCPGLDFDDRFKAAKELLAYEHPKMGETGKKQQRDNDAGDVVKGRFAPAKPPPSPQLKLVN